MVTTTAGINKHWAVEIDEDFLREAHRLMSEFTGSDASVAFDFNNDIEIKSSTMEEVLVNTNNLSSGIKRVAIFSWNGLFGENRREASLYLYDSNITRVIGGKIEGPLSETMGLVYNVDNLLRSRKKWYSFVYFSDTIFFIIMIITALSLYYYVLLSGFLPKNDLGVAIFSMLISAICATTFLLGRCLFFPRMIFRVGVGIKRREFRRGVTNILFTAVFLAFVVGIAVNFITDYMKSLMK